MDGVAWQRWLDRLERIPSRRLGTAAVIVVAALGVMDWLTGAELSFAVFYLIPVSLAAWYVGRAAGIVVSGASAMTWLIADVVERVEPYSHALVPIWNASTRLAFFLVVTFLLAALRRALQRERRLARTDTLTGAANTRAFLEFAERELARARRYERPFSLAYLDIDDFKVVNDRYGHAAGDEVLAAAAGTLAAGLRTNDLVARLGGDEFAILMPETDRDSAEQVTRRLHGKLLESARDRGWPVSFSFGVLTCERVPASVDELVRGADALMYRVKQSGKNRIESGVLTAERP